MKSEVTGRKFTKNEYRIAIAKAINKKSDAELADDLNIPIQRVKNIRRKIRTKEIRHHTIRSFIRETRFSRHMCKEIKHWSRLNN